MRRLAFEVISQSETKSRILVKINKPKKKGRRGAPQFFLLIACLDPGARTPIGASGHYTNISEVQFTRSSETFTLRGSGPEQFANVAIRLFFFLIAVDVVTTQLNSNMT